MTYTFQVSTVCHLALLSGMLCRINGYIRFNFFVELIITVQLRVNEIMPELRGNALLHILLFPLHILCMVRSIWCSIHEGCKYWRTLRHPKLDFTPWASGIPSFPYFFVSDPQYLLITKFSGGPKTYIWYIISTWTTFDSNPAYTWCGTYRDGLISTRSPGQNL